MSKLNIIRKCYSCGAVLQDEDPKKEGYISQEIFENDARVMFCDKCFKKETYDLVPNKIVVSDAFKTILADAHATDALIVYVIDLFSFEAAFSPEITKKLVGRKVLVIATKRDLLPKEAKDEDLKEDVAHRMRMEKIKVDDIILTSATSNLNIKEIIKRINELRRGHDVYLIGGDGAGKTYLINSILRNYRNTSNRPIKTMEYPGTSLSVLQIPLDKSTTLYDTGGLAIANSITEHLEKELHKIVIPQREIKEVSYKMWPEVSLFIGGIARFDFLKGKTTEVYAYFSRKVDVKRISTRRTDYIFEKAIRKNKLTPTSERLKTLADFNTYEINIVEHEGRDIGIQGLGWISFFGDNQTIRVSVPKGVGVYSCRAKIPHANKQRKEKA
ncbi:MAG: 50S ribosome-binding GTPase [Bacilli bacterium]|nr:50S ribosome-binding GTPase [Bacilli bacterium]